jgi:hypothetical protein
MAQREHHPSRHRSGSPIPDQGERIDAAEVTAATAATATAVRIDVCGVWADVCHDGDATRRARRTLRERLRDLLSLTVWDTRADPHRGVVVYPRPLDTVVETADGGLRIPAGLVPEVRVALEREGWAVEVRHPARPRPVPGARISRFEPDMASLERLGQPYRSLLEKAIAWQHALIAVPDRNMVPHLVEALCRLYPDARVMIVSGTRAEVWWHRDWLGRRLGRNQVSDSVTPAPHGWARCHVVPGGGLMLPNPDRWEMAILIDAHEGVTHAAKYRDCLARMQLYSFLSASGPMPRREALLLQSLFGPFVEADVAIGPVAVGVAFVGADGAGDGRAESALGRKRRRWHDARRNGQIGHLAQALAAGRLDDLVGLGLVCPERLPALRRGTARRLALLVEVPEHARALGAYLPGWASPAPTAADGAVRLTGRDVLTWVQAAQMWTLDVDVLVRCDGNDWPPEWDCLPAARTFGPPEALVIDVADDGDRSDRAAARLRLAAYERRGWDVVAAPRWLRT